METEIINMLVSGGSNAGFALFLLWQFKRSQAKEEENQARFDAKEKELRDRYDTVIAEYREKESRLYEKIERLIRVE